MAITVNGVEVRPEEINLEVKFDDLTEGGQKRIFLENKEEFLLNALDSKYPTVRGLLWEPEVLETCSSDLLNEAIRLCCIHPSLGDIMTLVKAVGSELSESNRESIACSPLLDVKPKVLVAQDEKTPLWILEVYHMFTGAAIQFVQSNDSKLLDAIVMNPNFRISKKIESRLETGFWSEEQKMIRERIEQKMKK